MRLTPLCLASMLLAGCATAQPRAQSGPTAAAPPAAEVVAADASSGSPPVSSYIQQVRELSRRARPASPQLATAEQWSRDLGAAIARLAAAPTAGREVELAHAYVRAGILDQAYDHFAKASRLDPAEAAAWDGLARIWRDWGYPQFGLGHSYRAVHADPRSPAVRNTLGTILQNLGKGREAREQFSVAVALDPDAAYAYNNLCYSWLMEANSEAAASACGRAIDLDPGLTPARNNLALTRAVDGDLAAALEIFAEADGHASAQYNLGIVLLSQRRYSGAADAFERAARLQPAPGLAAARARQARQRAIDTPDDERVP